MRARHALVGFLVVVLAGLAFAGCLGPAVGDERIASYDVVAIVREDRTVAVREVIDWDFGGESRRGIFRSIPWTGGVPTDIEVSSPDAPDDVTLSEVGQTTEVKIGDPDITISGRHRYVISYVLPATIQGDRLAFNAVGQEFPVGISRATVTVLGVDLGEPRCFTGAMFSDDRCGLNTEGDTYRVEVDGLDDHEGVTVDGDVRSTRAASLPDLPPFEERDASARLLWALVVAALGAVMAAGTYVTCRQLGRNEVAGGGATDAAFAYGREDFGPEHAVPTDPPPPMPGAELVADTHLGDLAGIEFVPPGGIEPWQAAVVLRETIDDRTVGSWFSSLAGHDVVTFEKTPEGTVSMVAGPKAAEADAVAAPILNRALGRAGHVTLGSYEPSFSTAWTEAGQAIDAWVMAAGVFRRRPPRFSGATTRSGGSPVACIAPAVFVVIAGGGSLASGLRSGFAAVAATLAVTGLASLFAYRKLTRGRSATGSAIALKAESFRRFLHDSEAQHVDWAWQHGLLREYSAWAVALGEADAWNGALAASSVPPVEAATSSGVLYPAIYASSFASTTTAPQAPSSGGFSGGGGGFSGGGFSGGGGGGGGGGSW